MLWACPANSQVSPLPGSNVMISPTGGGNLAPRALVSADLFQGHACGSGLIFFNNSGLIDCTAASTGTVTNATWNGGIVSITTPTTTPAFTIAGTAGGVVYFPTASTWTSTASGTATQLLHGGGGTPVFGAIVSADVSTVLASPPPVGSTAANTGAFTVLASSTSETANGTFTANGLAAINAGVNITGASGSQPAISVNDTGTGAAYNNVPMNFVTKESYASFGDTNTSIRFVVQATKNVVGSTTTGSRNAATFQQLGAGGDASGFFTGAFMLAFPCNPQVVCNAFNLGGNFTGSNPYVNVPTGMAIQSAVGEECDNSVLGTTTVAFRECFRLVDILGAVNGTTVDAAINIASSGVGWKSAINLGDGTSTFGLSPGGSVITSPATTVILSSLMNFNAITGIPTLGGIVLGPNAGQNICWGLTSSCLGGQISSQTVAGGGAIIFINGFTAFQFAGVTNFYAQPKGTFYVPVTFASLPACAGGTKGYHAEISDQTIALAFNAAANGGGAISAAVRCDGTSWKDF